MKILVIVNQSPWGATLPAAALRMARAMDSAGHEIDAVFFRGDGVYNAVQGRAADAGTPDLAREWDEFSGDSGFPLMLCSASASRRLDSEPRGRFREAGLAEMLERMMAGDRVVTF